MNAAVRVFEAKPAVRESTGLMASLVGPSGGGKTYSALRLASGIRNVVGGEIDLIDTENGRALHYADDFRFNHVRFAAPFSPLDYLAAIRYCAQRGAKTVIVDSMSHEHDGPGGVLEWHDNDMVRLAQLWNTTTDKANLAAWKEPKSARKRLIVEMLQLNINIILTFRAKDKIKPRGGQVLELGWMPICGEEFMYEMALQILLRPGANGVPDWHSDFEGERSMMKLPKQFMEFFGEPKQIDEQLGERLAKWAAGGIKPAPELDALIADFAKCESEKEYKALEKRRAALWAKPMPAGYKARVKDASDGALKRIMGGSDEGPGAQADLTEDV
jgi:hypothetical protein